MNEIEKVAVLLIAIGPEHAKRVLDKLSPDEMLPIIEAMRHMSKVSVDERMAILEEVNDILENLAAQKFPGSSYEKSRSTPEREIPESEPASARDLISLFGEDLPRRIDPGRLEPGNIDWGAAGFDFGEGNRRKRRKDDESGNRDR